MALYSKNLQKNILEGYAMFPGTLYETHVHTKNLGAAIEFYTKLGLVLAHTIEERRVAFFWFDKKNKRGTNAGHLGGIRRSIPY